MGLFIILVNRLDHIY